MDPAPRRTGPTWAQFLRSQAEAIIAADFFWDPDKAAVVIEDGEGGTVFTPRGGYNWFKNVLQ